MKVLTVLLTLAALMAGCVSTPPTSVHQPMTVRPTYQDRGAAASGGIFQAYSARPLFEDRRARYVGDILTVNIRENNRASAEAESNASRSAEVNAKIDALNVPPFNVNPLNRAAGLNAAAKSDNIFSGSGDVNNNNVFQGIITVTVIEVLPNGNLLVSGEKQVSIGHQQEFIRLSGVVNPLDIRSESVDSSRIADARIEYKSAGYISEAQVMGWLARFFLTALPF